MRDVIKIRNLGKSYKISKFQRIHQYHTFREDLVRFFKRPFQRAPEDKETLWALNDISLDIREGEKIGIIGPNGAGKSTLLKILSRITEPTKGYAEVNGRIGALLEVGTGFHPELTGRENIFLSGTILGMKRQEIQKRFDEIVDFAGIESFLDTPVKRYSSGMFLRLAFSVMAHLDDDILIIDEVLAVGDAAFQKKCLSKMEGVSNQGKTVLFVSHQMASIAALCPRSILLHRGNIVYEGESQAVIDRYYATIRTDAKSFSERKDRDNRGRFHFTDAWIENSSSQRVDILHSGESCHFVIAYQVNTEEHLEDMVVEIGIENAHHGHITSLGAQEFNHAMSFSPSSQGTIACYIPKLTLNSGTFIFHIVAKKKGFAGQIEDQVKCAGSFTVEPGLFFENGQITPKHLLMVMEHNWRHHP